MNQLIQLHQLLAQLRLKGMDLILEDILGKAEKDGLSVQEVLHELLLAEKRHKQERSLHYRIKQADLPFEWGLDSFPFERQPCIDKSRMMTLAGLGFIQRAENIVFIGPTGVGKTGLALGLLRKALLQGYRGKFYKVQNLMDQLFDSLADRSSPRFLKRLANYDLLLLDELGYLTLGREQMNMFFRLMDERYSKNKPTMITTNLKYDEWYEILEPAQMVAALLDRLQHHCVTINMIDGDSLRRPEPAAT
jgi:DNA replication protein DnaC